MTAAMPTKANPLAAIDRADERWCKRHPHYERADPKYLQALAAAVTPLLQPAATEPERGEVPDPLVEALAAERDRARHECARKASALEKAQAALAKTTGQLDELQTAHDELATRHGQLHRDHAACTSLDEALHDERDWLKAQVAKANERADFARIDRAAALGKLRALLEQILGEPVDGRASAEHLDELIARAGLLVAAAVDQIDARLAEDVHVHQYPLDASGKPGDCGCGKKFPQPKGRR